MQHEHPRGPPQRDIASTGPGPTVTWLGTLQHLAGAIQLSPLRCIFTALFADAGALADAVVSASVARLSMPRADEVLGVSQTEWLTPLAYMERGWHALSGDLVAAYALRGELVAIGLETLGVLRKPRSHPGSGLLPTRPHWNALRSGDGRREMQSLRSYVEARLGERRCVELEEGVWRGDKLSSDSAATASALRDSSTAVGLCSSLAH
mmetsp:Transcript_33326/g.87725  ORF Transcript_33326/g.87725 Transcript_33326/m.87725 type:complete len:208 (-) Transcript_33326:772-1395(-)